MGARMTIAGLPSPGTVSAVAWVCVGLYVLGLVGWEWRKTVRHARRERRQTQQFADAAANPAERELVTSLTVEASHGQFDDLVGHSVRIRVDGGEMQSTTLVHVAYAPGLGPHEATLLTVSPAVIVNRSGGPHRFVVEKVKKP